MESVTMLTERNVYWVPSVGNFDNIYSAIVIGDNLHVFQMTLAWFCKQCFVNFFVVIFGHAHLCQPPK
jgi:hypothetical protein